MKNIKIKLVLICTLLLSNSVASQSNVLSNHYNLRLKGWNDKETVLNTQNVSTSIFTKLFTKSVENQIYGQPISFTTKVDVVNSDLVWSDEFNGSGAINSGNWFQQTQLPDGGGWYNGEMQHYTNSQTNSFQSNGSLNLVARKETFTDQGITKQYTSARLNSKFAFKYGRVEVRAKLPSGVGTWPAIWMLGKNIIEPGGFWSASYGTLSWPACGEVDIMEHWGSNQNYVQSAMHTPSSSGGTINLGGQTIATASSAFHIYTMDWTAEKIVFSVDGVTHYTYNPSVKNASTWPFDSEQYLLLNLAIQSNISSNFTEGAMEVDYVRVYKNTTVDSQAPTNLAATVGAITGSSVELLLNATDNSGNVTYNVAYGSRTSATFGTSGVQKSLIIANLSPNTNYTFTVTATDATGNTGINNPILVTATTSENTTTACAGTTLESSQGAFSTGYKYAFETIGTDVKFTFELLDADKVGVVAFLWKQTPFGETAMTKSTLGNIFTSTISGQTIGSTISYAVKFAYAGGMSVTKYFPYLIGSSCETSPTASSQIFCGIATVASIVATGTALKWYDVSAGGTALTSSTALTTKTYYVSQTLAGTESARTAVSVTITPATTTGTMSASTCGSSYTWPLNGQTYTSSGTYTYIIGCNTATLTLVLTNATTNGSVIQSQAGGSYTWPANGQTYTASTTQTVVSGCNTATLNLTITLGPNDTQPTTSAPVPTKLATDVKSVFSDTYTNISTVELFPDWQQGTKYVNYLIPTSSPVNNVIKYSNLDYQGINITAAGNPPGVDFSGMTTLHIDVWTPDVASFKLFPIDNNTDLIFKTLTPTKSGWNSYDIVLATDFPTLNKASIRQFKFEKTAFVYKGEINTIYFDNIYFWRAPADAPTASSQTFCGTATVASLVATGTALKWYDVSSGGTAALSSSTALTTKTYYVSQTLTGIESTRTAVPVIVTPATTIGSVSVPACGSSYTWPLNSQSYTSSGTYTYIVGCNTATLTLVLTPATNHTTTVSSLNTYTWTAGNGQTYTTSGTKTGATTNCVTELLLLTITTNSTLLPTADTTYNFCTGAKVSALTAAIGTGVKAYATSTGVVALGDIALTGTTAKPVAYYLSEPTVSGEIDKVRVYVIINALPAAPSALVLTNENAILPATSATAVTAVGLYTGTNTPFKLTATAAGTGLTYKWTLPTGVVRTDVTGASTDISTTSADAFIYVKFTGTVSATPLVINVQTVNASNCTSVLKASASLTRLLPSAPAALALNNVVITTAITSFAKYMGSSTVLRLSATASVTATSYLWELPTGVNRMTALEGGSVTTDLTSTEPFIYVNFAGVTKDNTDTNSAVAVLTKVLRIGVKSVNGVGFSTTVNSGLLSTAKLLTLTATAPAAPASLAMNNGLNTTAITVISKMIGQGATVKLLAAASAIASSYAWELPACVTRVTDLGGLTADNASTSTDPFIYVKFNGSTNPAAGSIYFGVKAVNGVGSYMTSNSALVPSTTSTAKLLKLVTVVPAAPATLVLNDVNSATPAKAITVVSKYVGSGTTLKLIAAASVLANTYSWEIPSCVTRVADLAGLTADNTSTSTDPFIYVKFNGTTPVAGSIYFGVKAVNSVGSSITANTGAIIARTDKLLAVTGGLPVVVATVSGALSVCNRSEGFSYTITAPVGATSYTITAPAGSVVSSTNGVASAINGSLTNNVLTTSDLTFKVVYNGTAAFSTTDKSLVIRSANAFGPCLTTKSITLTKQADCTSLANIARLADTSALEEFNVIAYPNPSSDVFTLEVQSSGKGKATTGVQVYDVTGRLIEQRQVQSGPTQLGANYPSGTYILKVSQGENQKTLRLTKK